MRKLARFLALALVGVTSVMGLAKIPDEFRSSGTALQQSVAFSAALHSVLGALLVVGMLRRRPWAVTLAVAWTLAVVYTASVASVAWETSRDSGVMLGAVAAGISCALVGWWVVWAARESRHSTPDTQRPTLDSPR